MIMRLLHTQLLFLEQPKLHGGIPDEQAEPQDTEQPHLVYYETCSAQKRQDY